MKLALICPTIGQTRRGYERFMTELFHQMRNDVDTTLFKGAGTCEPGERVVRHVKRTGVLSRVFPNRLLYRRSQLEFATFALGLFPYLMREKFDLIHCIDPQLITFLYWMRRVSREHFRLLFTNGGPVSFEYSRYVDHVQCPTPTVYKETIRQGGDPERTSMVPPGVDAKWWARPLDRRKLRQEAGIPEDTFVILSITSINRAHKRVDYLIEEVSKMNGDFLLWIEGGLHPDGEPALLQMAAERLGKRFRHTQVASERVKELYYAADVMVSSALHESFGMAIVEAVCCGVPVVTHDSEHFRWLLGDTGRFVDMRTEGTLAAKLSELMRHREKFGESADCSRVAGRFGWDSLREEYLKMYEKAAVAGLATVEVRVQ